MNSCVSVSYYMCIPLISIQCVMCMYWLCLHVYFMPTITYIVIFYLLVQLHHYVDYYCMGRLIRLKNFNSSMLVYSFYIIKENSNHNRVLTNTPMSQYISCSLHLLYPRRQYTALVLSSSLQVYHSLSHPILYLSIRTCMYSVMYVLLCMFIIMYVLLCMYYLLSCCVVICLLFSCLVLPALAHCLHACLSMYHTYTIMWAQLSCLLLACGFWEGIEYNLELIFERRKCEHPYSNQTRRFRIVSPPMSISKQLHIA